MKCNEMFQSLAPRRRRRPSGSQDLSGGRPLEALDLLTVALHFPPRRTGGQLGRNETVGPRTSVRLSSRPDSGSDRADVGGHVGRGSGERTSFAPWPAQSSAPQTDAQTNGRAPEPVALDGRTSGRTVCLRERTSLGGAGHCAFGSSLTFCVSAAGSILLLFFLPPPLFLPLGPVPGGPLFIAVIASIRTRATIFGAAIVADSATRHPPGAQSLARSEKSYFELQRNVLKATVTTSQEQAKFA